MRIIMMGTGPFAVPTFELLCDSRHEMVALFTRPTKGGPSRGGEPINPMRDAAARRGLPIEAPLSINAPEAVAKLQSLCADLFVVCDYGQILSQEALGAAKHGGVNLHASLLPKYRGSAPINWAVYHGEAATGVTVIHMTTKLDAGPCIGQLETPIAPEETTPDLEARLALLGAPLVLQCVNAIETGAVQGILQEPKLATKAPRLKKEDGLIDWSRSARQIAQQIKAFQPWPKSYSFLRRGAGDAVRVVIDKASALDLQHSSGLAEKELSAKEIPGNIVEGSGDLLYIATGAGWLSIDRLQPAGKKVLTVREFLNGYPLKPGDRFDNSV